ncbi:hypothetical protein NA78x_005187 [Anatilimnocola sp. NA78]|uniref:hypothetical protein n=1 Tax=Anatilimnocola sp. NA78 TaxID=3415683 RepID=UPI003CE50825
MRKDYEWSSNGYQETIELREYIDGSDWQGMISGKRLSEKMSRKGYQKWLSDGERRGVAEW